MTPSRKKTVTTVICHTRLFVAHLKSRKSMRCDKFVLGKQASGHAFADSGSLHLHTPGHRTCRLQRQQNNPQ